MKEPTATFQTLPDNPDAYTTKTTPPGLRQIIGCVYEEGLNTCVKNIVSLFANLTAYNTAREIVRYYYTLGILTDNLPANRLLPGRKECDADRRYDRVAE